MNNSADKDALLGELRILAKRGPIRAIGTGSNSIGKTLQSSLGIAHSVRSRNSKYGYTITSTRSYRRSAGRTNLFACVADWEQSNIKSSTELADRFGRPNPQRGYISSLFCTTSALNSNSFGLRLSVDLNEQRLSEIYVSDSSESALLYWDTDMLAAKLKKLGQSAIVTGLPVEQGDSTAFHFRYVEILGEPRLPIFLELLAEGAITIDHCISRKDGSSSAREQGPLFKIRGDARDYLYGSIERIDLLEV